jgi:hypothetical protein
VEIVYLDEDGMAYPRTRLRYSERKFAWSPGTEPLHLYGLWRPVPWGQSLVLCEGESDCWALWACGIPALGVPGAGHARLLDGRAFAEVAEIAIVQEPDEAGATFAWEAAQQLYGTGYRGKLSALSFAPAKDPRETYNAYPDALVHLFDSNLWRERTPIPRAAPLNGPRVYTYAEILAMPPEVHHWRIEGIIHEGGVGFVVARPKVGKSTLLRTAALAILRGEPFLERATVPSSVLWLALEEARADVLEAFATLGLRAEEAFAFYFGEPPEATMAWLREVSEAYDTIVIDTLGKFFPRLRDINDYAEMTRWLRDCERYAHDAHKTLLFAHHAGWSSEAARALGSTAIAGAADVTMALEAFGSNRTRVIRSSQRSGRPFDGEIVHFDATTGAVSLGKNMHEAARDLIEVRILGLFANDPLTRDQILRIASGNAQTKMEALSNLIHAGELVVVDGAGTKGHPLRYLPKAQAGHRSFVVLPFPTQMGVPRDVEPEWNRLESERPDKNPLAPAEPGETAELQPVIVVGGVRTDRGPCCVCGEVRAAYPLADGRAWCAVCYDAGRRP